MSGYHSSAFPTIFKTQSSNLFIKQSQIRLEEVRNDLPNSDLLSISSIKLLDSCILEATALQKLTQGMFSVFW